MEAPGRSPDSAEAPGRSPEEPVKNTPTCTVSLCLFHGIRSENEGKKSWLGLQQNDSLVRPDIFCSQAEEGQAVGMVQANKLFVDAFFFFLFHANIRLFWSN